MTGGSTASSTRPAYGPARLPAPTRASWRSARRYRPHLLTEPEEKILAEKAIASHSAWSRLFGELVAALRVTLDDEEELSLEVALSRLQSPDREQRRTAAQAVSDTLGPGLRTRAFIYNTLLHDK